MRNSFVFLIAVLFYCSIGNARQPIRSFDFTGKTIPKKDTIPRTQLYLGVNFTQILVGDVEIHAMYRFRKRYSIMSSAGYDFNTLDFGRHLDTKNQCANCYTTSSEDSRTSGRYFWGNGVALRLVLTDTYVANNLSHFFLSFYGLLKYHNYHNYYFGEHRMKHSESGDQQIAGAGFYVGYELLRKRILIRPYGGLGFRSIQSKIMRPEISNGQTIEYPETHFNENNTYPALDIGIIFLTRATN